METILSQHRKTFPFHYDGSCWKMVNWNSRPDSSKKKRNLSVYPWWIDSKSITWDCCAACEDQIAGQQQIMSSLEKAISSFHEKKKQEIG